MTTPDFVVNSAGDVAPFVYRRAVSDPFEALAGAQRLANMQSALRGCQFLLLSIIQNGWKPEYLAAAEEAVTWSGFDSRALSAQPMGWAAPPALDPNETDPITLWAEIARLQAAVAGPEGYASWQEAATAERLRRVRAEKALEAQQAAQPAAWKPPAECDSPLLCVLGRSCAGRFGTKAQCSSAGAT